MALHLLLVDSVLGYHELLPTAEVSATLSQPASPRNVHVDGEEYGDGRAQIESPAHRLRHPSTFTASFSEASHLTTKLTWLDGFGCTSGGIKTSPSSEERAALENSSSASKKGLLLGAAVAPHYTRMSSLGRKTGFLRTVKPWCISSCHFFHIIGTKTCLGKQDLTILKHFSLCNI